MKRVAPGNHLRRQHDTVRRTNPKPYWALYHGHTLHCDQNEKNVLFGCTFVAYSDGFSSKTESIFAMPKNFDDVKLHPGGVGRSCVGSRKSHLGPTLHREMRTRDCRTQTVTGELSAPSKPTGLPVPCSTHWALLWAGMPGSPSLAAGRRSWGAAEDPDPFRDNGAAHLLWLVRAPRHLHPRYAGQQGRLCCDQHTPPASRCIRHTPCSRPGFQAWAQRPWWTREWRQWCTYCPHYNPTQCWRKRHPSPNTFSLK